MSFAMDSALDIAMDIKVFKKRDDNPVESGVKKHGKERRSRKKESSVAPG